MKKYLIDTSVLLWAVSNKKLLSNKCKFVLLREKNEKYLSIASVWEISIKSRLNKLELPLNCEDFINVCKNDLGFELLPIDIRHVTMVEKLPFHHRDPFDRLISAQAKSENMKLISNDKIFDKYIENRLW